MQSISIDIQIILLNLKFKFKNGRKYLARSGDFINEIGEHNVIIVRVLV